VDERWLLVGQGGNIGYSVTESWCLQIFKDLVI
jgi:hypothetical protein